MVFEASDESSELDDFGGTETASPFGVTVIDSDTAGGTLLCSCVFNIDDGVT